MRELLVLVGMVLLGGCVSSRLDTAPERFVEHRSIRVAPSVVEQFVACLTSGFDDAHWMLTNSTVRQTRQVGATRVETMAGGRLSVVVATVQDGGTVTLHENRAAALINTRGELAAFDACAERYGTPPSG